MSETVTISKSDAEQILALARKTFGDVYEGEEDASEVAMRAVIERVEIAVASA